MFLAAFAREQATPSSNPVEPPATAADDRLNRLDHEIAHLPKAYKEALLLTSLGGLSQQDAAAELGISVKAVEMRVYRAKRQLATRLIAVKKR
jgi:RNA polymerase sigma factor (sigma-70 family)